MTKLVRDDGRTGHDIFAENYVRNGSNATQAAKVAGYSERSAAEIGRKLLANPRVQAEIRAYQLRYLGGELANLALSTLRGIMVDEAAPASARVESAKTILDRAGISKTAVVADNGKQINEMSEAELLAIINNYQNKNKELADDANAIEGDAVVLPDE